MSRKNHSLQNETVGSSHLPSTIHLTDLANQPHVPAVASLKQRIEQLETKVNILETKIRSKRKRIRRKSCDVDKKHTVVFD